MKTLRTFIIMAGLFIGGLAMNGCEDSNASIAPQTFTTNRQQEVQTGEKPKDYNGENQILDSISTIVPQAEELSNGQEANTNKLNEVINGMSELKGSSRLEGLISLLVAVIALLVAIISLIKLNSVQRRNLHHMNIGELGPRINSLEQKINAMSVRNKTPNSGRSNSEFATLKSRIYQIERQLEEINKNSTKQVSQHIVISNPVPNEDRLVNEQSGYFGLPTQMSLTEAYFKRLSENRDSDSRFTVEVRNDKAEFRPLEGTQYLNDLKSNDSIKMALEIQGCAPSVATQMKVILPGEAKKDGDRWIITKKATIVLY